MIFWACFKPKSLHNYVTEWQNNLESNLLLIKVIPQEKLHDVYLAFSIQQEEKNTLVQSFETLSNQ